jgi:SagB-type dehydrogenase family enzyme
MNLVNTLRDYGYWRQEPTHRTDGERRWLDVEWNDALQFHTATRNMIWSHDYSGDPKVMTRYHVEHNVAPETEPPSRYQPEVTANVPLPKPTVPHIDFHRLAQQRRTSRDFRNTTITLADLATILSWTFKPQFPQGDPRYYATQSYSRGAPFTAFIITGGEGAPSELERHFGVYHYSPERHELGLVNTATDLDRLDALLWRQNYVNYAPAMLVVCADWPQFHWKYRFSRAYRFVYAECGAFMHTALLVGTALGLKTFQTPAIDDQRMCQTLDVADHELGPIYMATFGRG